MAARRSGAAWSYLALAAGSLAVLYPFLWMIATALKTPREIFELHFWPHDPTLANFRDVLVRTAFPRWFGNSLGIALVTTASVAFFDSLTGYTLAKLRFPGRGLIFAVILSTLMIPTEMLVIPWYTMSAWFGWIDTYWGIMFPGLMSAFGVFLMRQAIVSIPTDYLEAARIDGAGELRILWRIVLPRSNSKILRNRCRCVRC